MYVATNMVKKQAQTMSIVPRPLGSSTHPSANIVVAA